MNSDTFPFLDRNKERTRIANALNRNTPQLIVLYGRRRCGKSRLLCEMLNPDKDIYYHADRTDSSHQIELFAHQASTIYDGFDKVIYTRLGNIVFEHQQPDAEQTRGVHRRIPLSGQKRALPSIHSATTYRHKKNQFRHNIVRILAADDEFSCDIKQFPTLWPC